MSDSGSGHIGIACADSAFPRLSHDAALRVIADLGIPAVDICVYEESRQLPTAAILADPRGWADGVRRRVDKHGLEISDVFVILRRSFDQLAVNHPSAAARAESWDAFYRSLEFVTRLEATGLTSLPGMPFMDTSAQRSRDLAGSELEQRAQIAANAGIALSVEPHLGSIVESPSTTSELLAQAPHLTLTLDYSHFVYQGFRQAEVDVLVERTRHVHVRQAAPGSMQLPAEGGTIDFGAVIDRLRERNYSGWLAIEYQWDEWMEFNRVDCVSETAVMQDILRRDLARSAAARSVDA